jgi:AbiV family abortive infection protein
VKNNPLSQYQGPLSASQAAEGINIAAANAKRLAEDAKLLLDAGRYPTATSLAMLAIEESGKTSILRHMLLAASENELRECWRRYRKHTEKNHFVTDLCS